MTIRDLIQKLDGAVFENHQLPGFLDQEVVIQCLTIGPDLDKIPRLVLDNVHTSQPSMSQFPALKLVVKHEGS